MTSEIRNAIDDFLLLVWSPADTPRDVGQLIQSLDRLAYLAHGIEYEFDGVDYPPPPGPRYAQTFSQAETWLKKLLQGTEEDRYAAAVDDLAGIIDDLEEIGWRFRNTSEADALCEFELGFQTHWGHHLRSLQHILHDWYW